MRTPFDLQRLIPLDLHGEKQQVNVTALQPLTAALASGQLQPSTPVLFTQQNNTLLVFQTRHFSLYNVMQGEVLGQPWMATFCAVCNAGMSFSPVIRGTIHEFYGAGFYDAMTLLADKETGSYWDHITGECISGELSGVRLQQLANMTHSTAGLVARDMPKAQLIVTSLDAARQPLDDLAETIRTASKPDWLPQIENSLDAEDKRLPRLEMGLGVWTPSTARYYRFQTLHALDNVLFDKIDGQPLVVYIDPETLTPSALYTDASAGEWRGDTLALNNQHTIDRGGLYLHGKAQPIQRPLQLFQRWYGFSLTFPGCEIYKP